ncbi:hypothetical protein [Phocaeicola sp.]
MEVVMGRRKRILLISVPSCIACMLVIGLFYVEHSYLAKIDYLECLLKEAKQREAKAVVVRHVSKQMEEIAYQQKEISDKQRKEAELQASENFRMKLRVEEEWKKAVTAQQEALAAYRLADKQKALAEERQYQAEYAKRVADTLTYLTLGRSLGSLSITQYKTGNYELAALLAYSAWNFVRRYNGDVFLPSVFNSLSFSAGKSFMWQKHKGGLTSIVFPLETKRKDMFYTVSKYGEVLLWQKNDHGTYYTKVLLSEQQFDFRTACMDSTGVLYALSFDGSLLKFSNDRYQVLPLKGKNYTQMILWNKNVFLFSMTEGLILVGRDKPIYSSPDITCVGRTDTCLFIGKKNGDIIRLSFPEEVEMRVGNYYHSSVTAFGYCHKSGQFAIGYEDGTILLFDVQGNVYQKLVGHRSAVASIRLYRNKLYSCSRDRTLRLWNLSMDRLESVVILESSSWLHSFEIDYEKEILLAGDENGILYQLSVSPDSMAVNIQKKLHRNFTHDEWTHYVGNQIPFEIYTSKEHNL